MAVVDGLTKARMMAIEANSVVDGDINGSGNLILTRQNGETIDAGHVVGTPGSNGRGIVSATINGSGHLIITYSDTTQVDVGPVVGADGEDAAPGSVAVLGNTTPIRTSDGRIKAEDPIDNDDVVTKLWLADQNVTQALPSGANLNDYKTNGTFYQNGTPSSGLNFPLLRAGLLEVFDRGSIGAWQRYTPYGTYDDSFYTRSFYVNTWYPWKRYIPESDWQSWTPVFLSANGTNPTMGNSTATGRYRIHGKTVHMTAQILFGSTFSAGTGHYKISLPVGSSANEVGALNVVYVHNGAERNGYSRIEGSLGILRIQVKGPSESLSALSATTLTPINGSRLIFTGTYEAA